MENGDLPKIAQVAELLIELELYLSFSFSNHWTICVVSSCAGPQLHLWENKWRRARIVFYIKWPYLGRDEIAARTSPKWVAVLAFNTILSLFDWLLHIFCMCLFRLRALQMSFEWGNCSYFSIKSRGFAWSSFISSLVTQDLAAKSLGVCSHSLLLFVLGRLVSAAKRRNLSSMFSSWVVVN